MVAPVDLYCKELRARHLRRTYASPVGRFIKEQCQAVQNRLQRRRKGRPRALGTGTGPEIIQEKLAWAEQTRQRFGVDSREAILAEWKEQWFGPQGPHGARKGWKYSYAALGQPDTRNLRLYDQLRKAESSALFQARTGRIGLRLFLHTANVPGIDTTLCSCGHGIETAEHLLLHCTTFPSRWSRGTRFSELVANVETVSQVAKQLIQSGRLSQFSLASRLLYGQEGG